MTTYKQSWDFERFKKSWDTDRFKKPSLITSAMCAHGCCDWCPQGCFDDIEKVIDEAAERLSRHMLISKIDAALKIREVLGR